MTDLEIAASGAVLLALIMIGLTSILIRMNAVSRPDTRQLRTMSLVFALTVVSMVATVIATAFFVYQVLGLPLLVFLGIFS